MTIDFLVTEPDQKRNSFSQGNQVANNYYRCFQNYYHGHNYLNPNPSYITNVNTHVNHWQLRDLLHVDQTCGDVYFTKAFSIWKLRADSNRQKTLGSGGLGSGSLGDSNTQLMSREVLQPDYSPKCFNVTDNGLMVIGGLMTSAYKIFYSNMDDLNMNNDRLSRPQKGLFTFNNPNLNVSKTAKLGEMINNSVSIYPHSNNHYKSFVCNNDSSLYAVDILNNDRLSVSNKIICEHDVSLNNVTKNPNSNLLTVTGDTSSIFLVDPNVKNGKIDSIKTNHDSGFGISYHPNGNMFATTFQDGHCVLYDIRNLNNPIHEIQSTRPGHQSGAFRSCKFSNTSFNDILVISEHVGRVHLIDLRNLNSESGNNHQVMMFPFALDQFGSYKSDKLAQDEKQGYSFDEQFEGTKPQAPEPEEDTEEEKDMIRNGVDFSRHDKLQIYDDLFTKSSNIKFHAPLVYDSDYLTNVNPKLFKHYTYQPQEEEEPGTQTNECSTSPTNTAGSVMNNFNNNLHNDDSYDNNDYSSGQFGMNSNTDSIYSAPMTTDPYANYASGNYQQSNNHIYGEMEICGLDWYDSKLLIGSQHGGITCWDVNYIARRSFGSFSFV